METSSARTSPGHAALRGGRSSLAQYVYHVTVATRIRERVFLDHCAARAAARCFHDPVLLGDARLLAWVLMPDQAHWLLQLGMRDGLPVVVGRLKSASARKANRAIGRGGSLWAAAYHDHALRREEDIAGAARYIVANPVRAGLANRIADYPYWNAIWL